ncbi:MAG: PQQ-binding-like beta-propeller repeat protein [Ardenticatenaceae bacterium]|nr:PQQ-binding-like beta-propeller repeat protein [Ardenticatenaceae bacterium]MCB8986795.1 PQQ-binding-like beta-propeller repeat protein [Ardenticatenaceae bacterium]
MLCVPRISALVNPRLWTSRRCPGVAFVLLFVLVLLMGPAAATQAQDEIVPYWQYAASARLSHILPLDLDQDNSDELVIVDETGRAALLNASGARQWTYDTQGTVTAVGAVQSPQPDKNTQAIVLGAHNRLLMLSETGSEMWQVELTAVDPPPTLFLSSGADAARDWQSQYPADPALILPYRATPDSQETIAVVLQSGQVQMFDGWGARLWRYARNTNPSLDATPHAVVTDMDRDGRQEILLGSFNPRRFSQLVKLNDQGQLDWEQNISGRLTALTTVSFNGAEYVAVGTSRGEILVYNQDGRRLWLRTLNKPITSLVGTRLAGEPALVAGTDAGTVVVFNDEGQRVWTRNLAADANRAIIDISPAPAASPAGQSLLAVILGAQDSSNAPADVLLINQDGRTLEPFSAIDTAGLTRLVDINHDGQSEVLLARFATVELLGLGSGASKIANEWNYSSLFAAPSAVLVVDFDHDGNDEILIGARDGRLHRLDNDGSSRWIAEPGGVIAHLDTLTLNPGDPPLIVVIHNDSQPGLNSQEQVEGVIELRQANGDETWQREVPSEITAVLVAQIQGSSTPEIIVGTAAGGAYIYDAAGNRLWTTSVDDQISQFIVQDNPNFNRPELLVVSQNLIYRLLEGESPTIVTAYPAAINQIYQTRQHSPESNTTLVTLGQNDTISGFDWRGIQLPQWPVHTEGRPSVSLQIPSTENDTDEDQALSDDAFLIATTADRLLHLQLESDEPMITWQLDDLPGITSLYWGDLDGDAQPEIVVGDSRGNVLLYSGDLTLSTKLNVLSGVYALKPLKSANRQSADLLVVTENGLVQLFRAKENRPPLLTNARVDESQGRYNFSVSVQDVERDEVAVRLELQNPATGSWTNAEEQSLSGNGTLFWPGVLPPDEQQGVVYRFVYDDGYHSGTVTPPPLPPPTAVAPPQRPSQIGLVLLGVLIIGVALYSLRQSQTAAARAGRFYRRLKQQPTQTLILLENRCTYSSSSTEFLLNLANQARQDQEWPLTSLIDGLFLLPNRPQTGISLINYALIDIAKKSPPWEGIARWVVTFKTSQALLEAPSITELSLLQPQLVELLTLLETESHWSPVIDALLPILTNLRDSERVEQSDDRLVYLSEANLLVGLLRNQLPDFSITIERTLSRAIVNRWSGLLSAEIEELRGQAELVVQLKTKRLTPNGRTDVVLEISNNGRAPAENILVVLDENPAYMVLSDPRLISSLLPGQNWQVSFNLEPRVKDRFRLALTITYDDRNKRDKEIAFADMVQLIMPLRDFIAIPNPYLPGTPLRHDSMVFFGREELFTFIAENAGRVAQRNVLILIGQRRTGKTSFLLRLRQHLPQNLLPVYIDCQSLGVIPGMPALLYELAWQIADALATRNITVAVPDPQFWQDDPTIHFQRRFLPQVQALLPAGTIMLLVFDEFEAFENLVNDGILPPTFFTYMRHLMQHSQDLSFLFVGTRHLEEMSADYWSVLFNMALYQKIGFLDEQAMTHLITDPVLPNLVYDDLALDKIRRVTAGHPYFLQLVCYTLVKQANSRRSSYVTISDVNAALDEMMRLGEVHFAYMWQRSSFAERALLTAVSHLMDVEMIFRAEDLMQYLETYGISLTPTEVTAALNTLVEREILAEASAGVTTQYELKIGLVGLWVAQHKSLSKLHAEKEAARANGKTAVAG